MAEWTISYYATFACGKASCRPDRTSEVDTKYLPDLEQIYAGYEKKQSNGREMNLNEGECRLDLTSRVSRDDLIFFALEQGLSVKLSEITEN
jgi:hypothetical protein